MVQNVRKIRFKNLLAYGLGDIYGGGSFFIIGTLFVIFLTDVVGLSPLQAGTVFIVGKIWDAISDPLMGHLSDRTRSRFGRRRLFFLIGFIPVGLSFIMLWLPVNFGNVTWTFFYYIFAYIAFCSVFTMVMIPYSALNADMTLDYRERTRLSGTRMIFSQVSALLAGVFPKLIVGKFADSGQGYLVMGGIFGVLYMLPWLFVYFGTWELEADGQSEKTSFVKSLKDFWSIFKNKSFRFHIGMYLAAYSAMDIMMTLFAYYLTYYIGRPALFPICLGSMVLTQIISLPIYVRLSNRIGSGKTFMWGVGLWGLAMVAVSFLSSSTPLALIILNCVMIGAGLSAGVMIPWAILPSVIDVDEMITSKRRAGVYSGMMTFIRKAVQAVVVFLVGAALTAIGYVPNVEQSAETLASLKLIFIVAPVILIVLGMVVAARFRITPETHAMLIQELERLRQGGSRTDVQPEVAVVCEDITGVQYQELYRAG